MSIMSAALGSVNSDPADRDLDTVPYSPADWKWYAENVADRTGGFSPSEPAPLPSGDDAPATDPGFTDCLPLDPDVDHHAILGRLLSRKAVSVSELNAMRTAFGYGALDASCYCTLPPGRCCCGLELYEVGIEEFTNRARAALADYDAWLDSLADEFDPSALDREHAAH